MDPETQLQTGCRILSWAFENRPKKVGDSLLKWLEQPTCDGHIIVETKSHGGTWTHYGVIVHSQHDMEPE